MAQSFRLPGFSDTGFCVPSGVKVSTVPGVKKPELFYTVTLKEYAEFRLYRLLDIKVPFIAKQDIVQHLYRSFLVEGVHLDDRSSG